MCATSAAITSSPGRQCTSSAIWLHMVPEGRNTAASLPRSAATRSCRALVVGSSAFCSSPTSASAMALRMAGRGACCRVAEEIDEPVGCHRQVLPVIGAHGTRSFRRRQVRCEVARWLPARATHCTLVLVFPRGERDLGGNDVASWRSCLRAAPCRCAVDDAACRGPVAPRGQGHGARRLQRPAGAQCLSAHHPPAGRPLDRLHRPPRRHQGGAQAAQSADRSGGVQRHVDHRRHRPAPAEVPAHIPGDEGLAEDGGAQMVRVCDGKGLPKGDPNAVYMLRTFGNKAHEIWNTADPEQAEARHAARRPQGHAQELVGMRHRHRLSGLRRRRAGASTA